MTMGKRLNSPARRAAGGRDIHTPAKSMSMIFEGDWVIIFFRGMEGTLRASNSGGLCTRGPRPHRPMVDGTRADYPPELLPSYVP
jgi:hypothetical protein